MVGRGRVWLVEVGCGDSGRGHGGLVGGPVVWGAVVVVWGAVVVIGGAVVLVGGAVILVGGAVVVVQGGMVGEQSWW